VKRGIPISGPAFDWEQAEKAQQHVIDETTGEVNWKAAMAADPGVVKCPGCGEYVWAEAPRMRCSCGSLCGRGLTKADMEEE
jgi:hypothetical protein